MPAASDALQQRPGATYDELVDLACRLNVWRTLESLLTNSAIVNRMVNDGSLRAVGAFFDAETGAVSFVDLGAATVLSEGTPVAASDAAHEQLLLKLALGVQHDFK